MAECSTASEVPLSWFWLLEMTTRSSFTGNKHSQSVSRLTNDTGELKTHEVQGTLASQGHSKTSAALKTCCCNSTWKLAAAQYASKKSLLLAALNCRQALKSTPPSSFSKLPPREQGVVFRTRRHGAASLQVLLKSGLMSIQTRSSQMSLKIRCSLRSCPFPGAPQKKLQLGESSSSTSRHRPSEANALLHSC